MQPYIQQIQRLITQNQTVKHHNRKLKKVSIKLIQDIKLFFDDLFPEFVPYKQQSLDLSTYSILPHYRREILAMRLDIKNQLSRIMIDFECEVQEQENETLSYVQTDLIDKFKINMLTGKNSLKARFNRSVQENNTLREDIKKLQNQQYNLNIQFKKADLMINEKEAQIQKHINTIQLNSVQKKTLQSSLYNSKTKGEELQKENIQLNQQINELHYRYTRLQREMLNKQKGGSSFISEM